MWFIESFKASVYNPVFYRSMKDRKFGLAFAYFSLIVFVAALIVSLPMMRNIVSFVFQPSQEADAIKQQALDLYPDWLEIRTEGGKLSTNAGNPFALPVPHGMKEGDTQDLPTNLIVINTEKSIELSDFEAYDTFVIVGADTVGFFDPEKKKVQIQGIGQFLENERFIIVKDDYVGFVQKIEKIAKGFGVVLLFLVPLAVFSGLFVSYFVYLLFGALVVWLAAWVRKTHWQYATAYKAGLYLITVPMLYNALTSIGVVGELPIPFYFTIVLFVFAIINISALDTSIEESVEKPSVDSAVETSVIETTSTSVTTVTTEKAE
jgi:hypothetical protein